MRMALLLSLHDLATLSMLSSKFNKQPFRVGHGHHRGLAIQEHVAKILNNSWRIASFLEGSDRFLQLLSIRELSCNSTPWIELKSGFMMW